VLLDRAPGHVTWGSADRRHTVTLAHVEASILPLAGVVDTVVRESARALPGARLVGRPVMLDIEAPAPRRDAAMLVRFRLEEHDATPLEVAQVWRRDSRNGVDIVATWTSADGSWPVPPRRGIPQGSGSR
jgi:hypothetical protein